MHVFPHGSTVQWSIRKEFRSEPPSPRKELLPSMKYEPDPSMATLRWYYTCSTHNNCTKQLGRPAREREPMPRDSTALDPFTRTVAEGKNPTALYSLRHLYNVEYRSMRGDPESRAGFHLLTGPVKPPGSGTGIPVRFGRKPVGAGGIQIWIQKTQFNWFVPVYRPVRPVYRPVWSVYQWALMGRVIFSVSFLF